LGRLRFSPGRAAFDAPTLDAQETRLGAVALHVVALECQHSLEPVAAAVFIGGGFPASAKICAERQAQAVPARPLEVPDLPVLQDQPIALRELSSLGQVWN
jgi:hypothetical protein